MIDQTAEWVAQAAGGTLAGGRARRARARAGGDRHARGARGRPVRGAAAAPAPTAGSSRPQALEAGAWGALVAPDHVERATAATAGVAPVIAADDPLAALQSLARAWRRELGCKVVGVTGSTGKTSTKDILAAILGARLRTHANLENLNTEIGLPLTILEAPADTEAMVLEMAMRGEGQIAELVAVAEPDVGVIVNVGPVHLELLGTVERVAAAKAELIRDLRPGAACVVPASEPLLDAHLRDDLDTITFGPGGEVMLLSFDAGRAEIEARGKLIELEPALRRAPQPAQHAGGGGRGSGRGRGAGGGGGPALLVPARRDRRAARRGDRGQRLLQRQPDVHAGGPPAPRRDARGPPRGGARHDGGAGTGLGRLPPRDRRGGVRARHRRAGDRGGGGHRLRRRASTARATPPPRPRRPERCWRRSRCRATACW